MNVILMVGDRREFAESKFAVDRRPDDVMIGMILEAIVVPPSKISFDNQETGGHVIVAVRNHRTPLAHGEDLPAERELDG